MCVCDEFVALILLTVEALVVEVTDTLNSHTF